MKFIHDTGVNALFPNTEPVNEGEYCDLAALESAVFRPKATWDRVDVYPSLPEKGAVLFHSLIANHPFANGNKRTAVIALDNFLYANSAILALSDEDEALYSLAKQTASYRESGTTHEEMLSRIRLQLQLQTITVEDLEGVQGMERMIRRIRRLCSIIRSGCTRVTLNGGTL